MNLSRITFNIFCSILLIIFVLIPNDCIAQKRTMSNDVNVDQFDSLSVFLPLFSVKAVNSDTTILDTLISANLEEYIQSVSTNLLYKKYLIDMKARPTFLLSQDELESVFRNVGKLNDTIVGSKISSLFPNQDFIGASKYALLVLFKGSYELIPFNPEDSFRPYLITGLTLGLGPLGVFIPITKTSGTHSFTGKSESRVYAFILDTELQEIVYYDSKRSRKVDPRMANQVRELVRKVLKPIYYKKRLLKGL